VTVQGALLILLLGLIAFAAWRGLESILEGFNRWTTATMGLVAATLMVASVQVTPLADGVTVQFTGKFLGVCVALVALAYVARRFLGDAAIQEWLWESWRFVKQIFPLLVAGVFAVGVVRMFIRPEWIESLAGQNSIVGNLAGVAFGVFMYFPTLVEVPIARMFLDLGMHRGPLLAYLMADPELSLQSILILSTIIGRLKAWTYVGWVALFSMVSGWLYGTWVDGGSAGLILAYLLAFLGLLAVVLWQLGKRQGAARVPAGTRP
jgi:uncharacterized membrane protein YraQ (UPF0718 family)